MRVTVPRPAAPSPWVTYQEHYAGYDVREFDPGHATDPGHPAWWLLFEGGGHLGAFFDEVDTTPGWSHRPCRCAT